MSSAVRRLTYALGFVSLIALTGTACQGNLGTPSSPSALGSASAASPSALDGSFSVSGLEGSPFGGNGLPLTEVPWSLPAGGGGTANTVATATLNTNIIEATINVHGAPPDTDLYFQIAHDAYLGPVPARGNGVCDRVAQFGFPNPPLHAGGDAGVIHTSSGGAASTHIKFEIPEGFASGAYEPGALLDQMFRVVNSTKTFELRTACMTLLMK